MDPPNVTTAFVAATTPVVLRIMPLLGSPAPIGYIYDPTPARDGDGGLLAAASAFFAHQGHQVFLDPCPDLAAYRQAGGFMEPIVDVDRLPDHVLSAGLDLLESPSASSAVDALGMSFMAAYLLAPAPVVPQGVVSLSPMGGDTARQPFSALSSTRSGGSEAGGDALARFTLPLCPHVWSPTRLTPLHHRGMHIAALTLTLASRCSLGLRRTDLAVFLFTAPLAEFPLRLAMGGVPAVKTLGQLFRPRLRTDVEGAQTPRTSTPTIGVVLRLLTDVLLISGGGSNSSDINTSHWGSSSSDSAPSNQVSFHSCVPDASSAVPTHSSDLAAPVALPPLPAAIPAGPIPLPVNRFTLPLIKTTDDYLAARDYIMYWLRRPGFSTARSDGALITDSTNALASQFWEGQLRTALKDSPARFLFENMSSTFYDKGFEMLQVLEDNFRPSSISNTFTTLLSLFNERQSDKEGITFGHPLVSPHYITGGCTSPP